MEKLKALKVKKVTYETDDAVSIHFKQPTFNKIKYKSGQFLNICVNINGHEYYRAYSLNSTYKLDDLLSLTVKKVEGGLVSNYLFEHAAELNSIKASKPMGTFVLEPEKNAHREIFLFAGGSGITPIMSIMKSVLHFEEGSHITLVYCNKNQDSVIFGHAIQKMKEDFPDRLKVIHIWEEEGDRWDFKKGFLNENLLQELLADHYLPLEEKSTAEFYMCGPEGLMDTVVGGLQKGNIADEHIHRECFTKAVSDTEAIAGETHPIAMKVGKKEFTFEVPENKSILEAALDNKIRVPYSCFNGACGSCMGKCTSGEVVRTQKGILTDKQIEEGMVLTCSCKPMSDDVTIEI